MSKCSTRSGTPASPRCRPTPSCTAPSSATSSNNPARGCASPPTGSTARSPPHAPKSLERLIVIGGADYEQLFAADPIAVVPRDGDDLAWLFYTSGTTGRPKGAMLTHRVLAAASEAYLAEVDTLSPGDPILHAAPMSHGSGLYIMAHVMRRGVNVVPESGGFEPEEIFSLFRAWPRTSMFAAPTMVKRLVECPAECPSENIRTIIWGGAPMYVEDARKALDRFGPRLAQIYGQGESPMTITVLSQAGDRRPRPSALGASGWRRSGGRSAASRSWWRTSTTGRCRRARPAKSSAAATS